MFEKSILIDRKEMSTRNWFVRMAAAGVRPITIRLVHLPTTDPFKKVWLFFLWFFFESYSMSLCKKEKKKKNKKEKKEKEEEKINKWSCFFINHW